MRSSGVLFTRYFWLLFADLLLKQTEKKMKEKKLLNAIPLVSMAFVYLVSFSPSLCVFFSSFSLSSQLTEGCDDHRYYYSSCNECVVQFDCSA